MTKGKMEKYVRAADAGDNSSTNFVNYGVKKKADSKLKLHRALLISGYVVFAIFYFCFFLGVIPGINIKLPMAITFLPLFIWVLVFFTWRYVSIECEYYILDGEMKFLETFGGKNMRELCRVRVSSMSRIAPYNGEYKAEADAIPAQNRCLCVSSLDSPDVYFGIFKDENAGDCVVFFEATEKTLKVIKYYNSSVILAKTRY